MTAPDPARLAGLLERLVAIDTQNPPGCEAKTAALLAAELDALGFATEIRPLAEGRANLVARLDNGPGPCFALNSHMDTVPVGAGWTHDPLRLTERDGRLYGRGACDAKGSVAAMAEAGRLLAAERSDWRGTLVLAFVADEEIDGGGSRVLVKQDPSADFVIVGEPTDNAAFAAHKGCLRPVIRTHGKAAHSGRPELGVNAIVAAGRLISIFDARDRELRATHHPLVGHASLTVSRISGGVADNIVPDACDLTLDRRMLPGETLDDALAELDALLTRASRESGVEARVTTIRTAAPGTETPVDHALVRAAVAASRRQGVTFPQPGGLTGGCDLVHYRNAGAAGIVLGPGSLDVAHQPDEYVLKDDLARAALIYREVVCAMSKA